MRTGLVLDWRRTRRQVVQQKFALRVEARFNPFRDSAGCTIAMRWQRRLKSNTSEDQTLLLDPDKARFTFSASIFRRATNQPAIQNRSTHLKWKEMLVMPVQRFGERQAL